MGKSQFNFSMPPENYYAPVRQVGQPARRKSKANVAAIAVASMLGGALATVGVGFALLPAVTGSNVADLFGSVAVAEAAQADNRQEAPVANGNAKTVPAVARQSADTEAKAAPKVEATKSPYPVHRKAQAVQGAPEAADDVNADEAGNGLVWVEGWTEKIVHPAVYEDIPGYESYLCSECGYESIDLSDIIDHIQEHESATYLTVENDGPHVELEKEWTETIYHEGHWA